MHLVADIISQSKSNIIKKLPNFGHLVSHTGFNNKMTGFSPTTYKISYKIGNVTPTYIRLTPLIFSLKKSKLNIDGICYNPKDKTLTFSDDRMESHLVTVCGDRVTFTLTTEKFITMKEASQGFLIEYQGITLFKQLILKLFS